MRAVFLCLVVILAGRPGGAGAADLSCVAALQCRGDAERMCAPSSLSIDVVRGPGSVTLWIDRQGPYPARARNEGGIETLSVTPLGADYRLEILPDGQFSYFGNRGKRYLGRCEEAT